MGISQLPNEGDLFKRIILIASMKEVESWIQNSKIHKGEEFFCGEFVEIQKAIEPKIWMRKLELRLKNLEKIIQKLIEVNY